MHIDNLLPFCANRSGTPMRKVKGVVIHAAIPGATAADMRENIIARAYEDPVILAGFHDIIDQNGDVLHMIPYEEIAWHIEPSENGYPLRSQTITGGQPPNDCLIGIALCHPDATARPTEETRAAAVSLCAAICGRYQLSEKDIYLQPDIAGDDCVKRHAYYWSYSSQWAQFKADTAEILFGELSNIGDICHELFTRGIIRDRHGMMKEMEKNPDGRLYWLGRKALRRIMELEKKGNRP